MNNEKRESIIEKLYETKSEKIDYKVIEKIKENKDKFKNIEEKETLEKVKEQILRKQIENLIKEIQENNNTKSSIIMKESYKQGFIDGINLIIESTL